MTRLAVISGKGGTGKTIITASLAHLLSPPLVLADCDVDAANLGILCAPELLHREQFFCMKTARIDPDRCTNCGQCLDHCRFHAVVKGASSHTINSLRCEGCAVCMHICPAGAIRMEQRVCGDICLSSTPVGRLAHGKLLPGSGNSGLLVHAVKKIAYQQEGKGDLFLVDGPPGTGCPLISTVTGMSAVLIVTEPSVSGLHDLRRVVAVSRQFTYRMYVVINRFDLEESLTGAIEDWCREEEIRMIGKIPFDPAVIEAVRNCRAITHADHSPAAHALQALAETIRRECLAL